MREREREIEREREKKKKKKKKRATQSNLKTHSDIENLKEKVHTVETNKS